MKIEDFQLQPDQAARLKEIDVLVNEGLSRERAGRLVNQLDDIINGAWADLLAPMANPENNKDKALLQTFWIAYIHQWAAEHILVAGLSQRSLLRQLAALDGNTRGDQ